MLSSIIVGAAVAYCIVVAQGFFLEGEEDTEGKINYVFPIVIGLVIALINFFAPRLEGNLWVAPIFMIAMIAFFACLGYEWKKNGATIKEMAPFLFLVFIFWWVTKAVAYTVSALAQNSAVMARFIETLPTVALILTASFLFVDYLMFRYEINKDKRCYGATIAVIVATIVGIILLGNSVFAVNTDSYATTDTKDTVKYHYYNDDVRSDDDEDNDFNFGPNPYVDGKDASYYAADFASRRDKDPALLSATALTLDSVTGSDYIGQILYEGYSKKLDVLQRANAATIVLADEKNTKIFKSANQAIDEMLASATSVELVKEENIRDQLYMNGYTINNIPQVVIYETDVTSDWCLVYTFKVKTSEVKVAFRIPCGYQWTNPSEVLGATVKTTNKDGDGNTPTPKPTPTPVKKDPTKDPVYQGNADIGGGKNKESDGTGEYQATKPSKESGKNADSDSSSSSDKTNSGSSDAPKTDPITPHKDSHDNGSSGAGNNNGEFTMD